MKNSKSAFILILFVIILSVLFIWPNIGTKTIKVYFLPNLSEKEIHESAEAIQNYLNKHYKDRFTGVLTEEPTAKPDEKNANKMPDNETKSYFYKISGNFVQAAFINELYRQPGVDPERIEVKKLWVEEYLNAKPFKLGLDLQGGMNLLMEADFAKLKKQLEEHYSPTYLADLKTKIGRETDKKEKKRLEYEVAQVDRLLALTTEQKKEYVSGAMEIIHSRIDKTGVGEPLIRIQGDDKIEISLPGVASPEAAKKIVSSTSRVEYRLSAPINNGEVQYQSAANEYFSKYLEQPGDARKEAFIQEIEKKINLPPQFGIYVSWTKDHQTGSKIILPRHFLILERKVSLSGDDISPKTFVSANMETGQNVVHFALTPQGTKKFAKITSENIGKFLAILIDDKVRSFPVIKSAIVTGEGEISGDFTNQEAKDLAMIIKEGALPVPMKIVEERSVGPSLGKQSIERGVMAIALGMLCVAMYMIIYYHIPGIISIMALLLNVLFMSAFLAMIDYTITLPGLAGVVLTFGMIVDSNVIIFERVREELHRGKSLKSALEISYDKSTWTIIDSNLTTIVAAILLMQFGVGPIKGFAVTLCIGILTSLFTSLYVSKSCFAFILYSLNVSKMSFGWGKYRKVALAGDEK